MKRKQLMGKKIKCVCCEKEFEYTGKTGDIQYRPLPYAAEIHGDKKPVWVCDECCDKNAEEI